LNLRPLEEIERYGTGTKNVDFLGFTREIAAFCLGV
jgi:hypothetical protein